GCFAPSKRQPLVATTSSPPGGNVVPGSPASDSATVSGIGGGPTPAATVSFFLCAPARVTSNGGDCSSGGTQVGSAVTLDANGQASSPSTTETATIGTYCWRAECSGGGVLNPPAHTQTGREGSAARRPPPARPAPATPTGG